MLSSLKIILSHVSHMLYKLLRASQSVFLVVPCEVTCLEGSSLKAMVNALYETLSQNKRIK